MKYRVAYMSETGNTEKVAKAIYEELPSPKKIELIGDADGCDEAELVFIGFPLHTFGPPELARQFAGKLGGRNKVALFVTHASSDDYQEMPLWLDRCRAVAKNADVLGLFHCQGEMAP